MPDDEITLEQAAELWRPAANQPGWSKDGKYKAFTIEERVTEPEHPANVPGAEATAVLETMLAAGRKGKVVRDARL